MRGIVHGTFLRLPLSRGNAAMRSFAYGRTAHTAKTAGLPANTAVFVTPGHTGARTER